MSTVKIKYTRTDELVPYQLEIIDCPERFAVIEACTKSGKTSAMIIWLHEEALRCKSGQSVFWVAPVFTQALIAFNRMKEKIHTPDYFKANESRMTLTLPHGAIIAFKSADNPDTLYGDDCYAAVIDEASRMKQEAWYAIQSTITRTQGKCKLIGNVKGRHNFFYQLAIEAKKGKEDFYYKKITAYDAVSAGIIKIEDVEQAKQNLPERVFSELYLAEASEDGGNPFGLQFIKQCTYPLSSNEPVCYGIDLGKSIDYTVIIGLDKNGCLCHFERFKLPWEDVIRRISLLKNIPVKIDSTGVGDPIVEKLQTIRQNIVGFKFSQWSKQQIMEGLSLAIQQRRVSFPDYTDTKMHYEHPGNIKLELEQFEFESTNTGVKYSAPSDAHDDCVCALALAWDLFKTAVHKGNYSWA